MWQKIIIGLSVSAGLIVGCDKDSSKEPPTSQTVIIPIPAMPTTKPALTNSRIKLDLKYAPFTLDAPIMWEIKSFNDGATAIVEGPTPTDTVGISIPIYRTITAEQEKSLEANAIHDHADHPDLMKSSPVRDMPHAKVIEQLILDAPTTQSAPPLSTEPSQSLQWTFTLCIPNGSQFTAYELRFMGLTVQQFKNDQAFLRSIINTIAYIPSPADPTVK